MNTNDKCIICLKKPEYFFMFCCNQTYHIECLREVFTNNNKCPICKRQFNVIHDEWLYLTELGYEEYKWKLYNTRYLSYNQIYFSYFNKTFNLRNDKENEIITRPYLKFKRHLKK